MAYVQIEGIQLLLWISTIFTYRCYACVASCSQMCAASVWHTYRLRVFEGLQCKTRYIYFVKFSGQAAQTVAVYGVLYWNPNFEKDFDCNVFRFDLWNFACSCRPGWRGFFRRKTHMCKFGVYRVLHWSPSFDYSFGYPEYCSVAVMLWSKLWNWDCVIVILYINKFFAVILISLFSPVFDNRPSLIAGQIWNPLRM